MSDLLLKHNIRIFLNHNSVKKIKRKEREFSVLYLGSGGQLGTKSQTVSIEDEQVSSESIYGG